jgi:hypothetical protein
MSKGGLAPTFSAILLFAGLLTAAEWWEKKPYSQWSDKEVKRMLDNSPWGKVHTVTIMNPTYTGTRDFRSEGTGDLEREKQNLFHLHFLTAKPIRMAIVRQHMLNQKGQADLAGLERFVGQTSEKNIILAMTLSSVPKGTSSQSGYLSALLKLSTPELTVNTSLASKSGKRVYLTRYDPPGQDGLGAKYYFPRYMEDGKPFLTVDDSEVRFETLIVLVESGTASGVPGEIENSRIDRIWMQFDLRKMVFEGKLEI